MAAVLTAFAVLAGSHHLSNPWTPQAPYMADHLFTTATKPLIQHQAPQLAAMFTWYPVEGHATPAPLAPAHAPSPYMIRLAMIFPQ